MMFGENSHNFIPPEIKTVSANDIAPLYQNGIVEKPLFIQRWIFRAILVVPIAVLAVLDAVIGLPKFYAQRLYLLLHTVVDKLPEQTRQVLGLFGGNGLAHNWDYLKNLSVTWLVNQPIEVQATYADAVTVSQAGDNEFEKESLDYINYAIELLKPCVQHGEKLPEELKVLMERGIRTAIGNVAYLALHTKNDIVQNTALELLVLYKAYFSAHPDNQ